MDRSQRDWIFGAIAVGVTIAALAYAAPGPRVPNVGCTSASCGPPPTALALSTPQTTHLADGYHYVFTVESAAPIRSGDLRASVLGVNGAPATATSNWSLSLLQGPSGNILDRFDFGNGTWTGGAVPIAAGQVFDLDPGGQSLSGCNFVLSGVAGGGFGGTLEVAIP